LKIENQENNPFLRDKNHTCFGKKNIPEFVQGIFCFQEKKFGFYEKVFRIGKMSKR
jgi:hypothetical protein